MIIGERLHQARLAAGMSLRELADNASMSAMAISKYERGQSEISQSAILRLSRALSVKPVFFFQKIEVKLSEPCHRKKSNVSQKDLDQVLYKVQGDLEQVLELERLFGTNRITTFKVEKGFKTRINSLDDVEKRVESLRKSWNLGLGPIESVFETLEDHGVKVLVIDKPAGIDGFSCWAKVKWINKSKIPVVVSRSDIPGDRQRFNMMHELGHLLLHLDKSIDKEKASHRFASAFLVPAESAKRELGAKRADININELILLKQKYGLSIAAWILRARDLEIINDSTSRRLFVILSKEGWRKKEPGEPVNPENSRRYRLLILQARAENLISQAKSDELLKEFPNIKPSGISPKVLEEAAELMAPEYSEGGELSEYDSINEEDFTDV